MKTEYEGRYEEMWSMWESEVRNCYIRFYCLFSEKL